MVCCTQQYAQRQGIDLYWTSKEKGEEMLDDKKAEEFHRALVESVKTAILCCSDA